MDKQELELELAEKVLALYNTEKHKKLKANAFLSSVQTVWKEYSEKSDTGHFWKSLKDFQKDITETCQFLQPARSAARNRLLQELKDLGGGDEETGRQFYEQYQLG